MPKEVTSCGGHGNPPLSFLHGRLSGVENISASMNSQARKWTFAFCGGNVRVFDDWMSRKGVESGFNRTPMSRGTAGIG